MTSRTDYDYEARIRAINARHEANVRAINERYDRRIAEIDEECRLHPDPVLRILAWPLMKMFICAERWSGLPPDPIFKAWWGKKERK